MAMSGRDLLDHAWVDTWLQGRPAAQQHQYTAMEWKHHFLNLSKSLSYILRHGAAENDLTLREDGYIRVAVLLAHGQFQKNGYTEEELRVAVEKNSKQRFALKQEGNVLLVRAQQGHTGKVGHINQHAVNTTLTSADVPESVIHGTFRSKVNKILNEGLKTMGRDHIHMASGLPGDGEVVSGCRTESDTFLKVNARLAIDDGIEFLRSGNGVILTAGIKGILPPKYIESVMDRFGNVTKAVNVSSAASGYAKATTRQPAAPVQSTPTEPAPAPAPAPAPSQLSLGERNFLKQVKKVRAILKLQEQKVAGHLEPLQEEKLATLPEAIQELADLAKIISADSDLREKNKDVLELCSRGCLS